LKTKKGSVEWTKKKLNHFIYLLNVINFQTESHVTLAVEKPVNPAELVSNIIKYYIVEIVLNIYYKCIRLII